MRRLPIVLCLLLAAPASAHVLELYAQPQVGGVVGHGISGAQQDADFFQQMGGGAAFGGLVGVEFMWVDAWVQHLQLTDFAKIKGTWTEFMVGADWDFPLGDGEEPAAPGGKKIPPKNWAEIGFGVGLGLGTGQQVKPPLDNAQVSDKGFMGQLRISAEHRFNSVISLGLSVPIEYGYMFKNGVAANDSSNQYMSLHASALVYLQFKLGLK